MQHGFPHQLGRAVSELAAELYAEIVHSRLLPAAYLAAFASLTVILLWQGRRDVQGRYLDYRALAEGLRETIAYFRPLAASMA